MRRRVCLRARRCLNLNTDPLQRLGQVSTTRFGRSRKGRALGNFAQASAWTINGEQKKAWTINTLRGSMSVAASLCCMYIYTDFSFQWDWKKGNSSQGVKSGD